MCISRQKPRLKAEKMLPRPRLESLDVLVPRLGLNVKLRYDIFIHNFNLFIFCIYVFKTKLQLCIKQRF